MAGRPSVWIGHAVLTVGDVNRSADYWQRLGMRLVQILDHEVERRLGVIGGRSRHEDEVGAAPKLEYGNVLVPLHLAHPEVQPIVGRPVDISDGQHRVSDPH